MVAVQYLITLTSSCCSYAFTMESRGVSQVRIRLTSGLVRDFFGRYIVIGSIASGGLAMFCVDHCPYVGTLVLSSAMAGDKGRFILYNRSTDKSLGMRLEWKSVYNISSCLVLQSSP